jgi:predicted nucleotidyltransferase
MFEEMIESYLARLKEIKKYDVKSVILFGSVARVQAKEHSDIDIIVVASGISELRNRDVRPPFPKPARIQDIWMMPEELEDMVMAKTGFLGDALLEGRMLQDDGTAAGAREKLVASLKRLKATRLKSGWMIPRETFAQ